MACTRLSQLRGLWLHLLLSLFLLRRSLFPCMLLCILICTLLCALLCTLAVPPVLRFCSACCSAFCSAMFLCNIALPSALHSALHWALRFCSEQASTLSQNALRARVAREQGLHVIRQTCCVAARPALAVLALRLLLVQGTQLKVPSCFRLVLSVLCCFFCCSRCFCVACNA